jgi:hypothetical protein
VEQQAAQGAAADAIDFEAEGLLIAILAAQVKLPT